MAIWAQIDENNVVVNVVVADSKEWLVENLGGVWIDGSQNDGARGRGASPGLVYDQERGLFTTKKPFASWVFNEETALWNAPIPDPSEEDAPYGFDWNEETLSWDIRPA